MVFAEARRLKYRVISCLSTITEKQTRRFYKTIEAYALGTQQKPKWHWHVTDETYVMQMVMQVNRGIEA